MHVVDVPAKLAARVRLFDTGHNRKTDALDRTSTLPRMSAAFHADRFAPSWETTQSAAPTRSIHPTGVASSAAGAAGLRKPTSRSSAFHRATRSAPSVGTTLSGRASAHARRSRPG